MDHLITRNGHVLCTANTVGIDFTSKTGVTGDLVANSILKGERRMIPITGTGTRMRRRRRKKKKLQVLFRTTGDCLFNNKKKNTNKRTTKRSL